VEIRAHKSRGFTSAIANFNYHKQHYHTQPLRFDAYVALIDAAILGDE
jgi:hypothetical protein